MATLPEGFEVVSSPSVKQSSELPAGFEVVSESSTAPAQTVSSERRRGSTISSPTPFTKQVKEAYTGAERTTPTIEALDEIGRAPELNELSMKSFKTSMGLLSTGDTESLKGIFKKQYGDNVSFDEDEKGNTIVNLPSGSYALNKPGFSPQDLIRGAFDIASFTPAGRASSIAGAGAKSAATQAAIEGAESGLGGGSFELDEVAKAALIGGAGKSAENVLGASYRAATGGASGDVRQVSEFAREQNLPLMTSDVVPPKTFTQRTMQAAGEKIPVVGTGGVRSAQQEAREGLVEKTSKMYGSYSPEDVISSLKRQTDKVKKAAGERIGNISRVVADNPAANKSIKAIDSEIDRLSTLPGGVSRQTADTKTIETLQAYRNDLAANPSFEALQDLRTSFRESVKGDRLTMPTQSDAAIQRIYKSMSDDLTDTVEGSMGRREAMRWRSANSAYANEANRIKNTSIKNALQKGDITPEVVNTMLYSNKPSDVKNLFRSLDEKGKVAARAGIIAKAAEKSAGSPDKFVNELNRLKAHTGAAFKGKDKAYINGLVKYLNSTKEAARAAVTTKSGQELFQIGAPVGVMTDIGTTGGAGTAAFASFGAMARAYESKPIRELMVRLASIEKGSTKFEKVLKEIQNAVVTTGQATREAEPLEN